jgi:hypothetical protein
VGHWGWRSRLLQRWLHNLSDFEGALTREGGIENHDVLFLFCREMSSMGVYIWVEDCLAMTRTLMSLQATLFFL